MKLPQLNIRDLFWLMLIVAMGCGWWLRCRADSFPFHSTAFSLPTMLVFFLMSPPLWCPLLFISYAIGKGKLTQGTIVAFVITELFSFALVAGLRELACRVSD